MIAQLDPLIWAVLALGALIVGISKTALPGATTLSVALFAAALPAKQSTGALLILLMVGDVFALLAYRRDADWRALLRMAPAVVAGLVAGWLFLSIASDGWVRRVIGVILLALITVTLWQRYRRRHEEAIPGASAGRVATASYGSLGGFTTMVANAGGPAMSMYLIAQKFPVRAFLGTSAWFFAIVNVAKLPFSVGLGIITPSSLLLDLVLAPAVLVGALVGRALVKRMDQRLFDRLVIALTILGAAYLLF